ncbi:cyclase family protein [Candidatus Magnetoovum chiemensis]|nr:cyclase family protein [Candidatus Magnetoovum chiemensis]
MNHCKEYTYKYLCHPFEQEIPVYGGTASVNVKTVRAIAKGDSCNIYHFELDNHWGTHIDCPNHFFTYGKKITDYSPDFWFFKEITVIPVSLAPGQILLLDTWKELIKPQTDLILFYSGWAAFRRNHIDYAMSNPGIHTDVGLYLRKYLPQLKAVGIDWLSVSSYKNRELGRKAHRAFLDPEGENSPILIIEDMLFEPGLEHIKEVMAAPMLIKGVDSAPCTVIGTFF